MVSFFAIAGLAIGAAGLVNNLVSSSDSSGSSSSGGSSSRAGATVSNAPLGFASRPQDASTSVATQTPLKLEDSKPAKTYDPKQQMEKWTKLFAGQDNGDLGVSD